MDGSSKKNKNSSLNSSVKKSIEELLLDDLLQDEKTSVNTSHQQDEEALEKTSVSSKNVEDEFSGFPSGLNESQFKNDKTEVVSSSLSNSDKSHSGTGLKNFDELLLSELNSPTTSDSDHQGTEADSNNATQVISSENSSTEEFSHEKLQNDQSTLVASKSRLNDATIAVSGIQQISRQATGLEQKPKVTLGQHKGVKISGGQVHTSADASLVQAENLRMAQDRILELEAEIDKLRLESDEVASAGETIKQKYEELSLKFMHIEKEKEEIRESYQSEITLLRSKADFKDQELSKAKIKNEELETRIKQDFKKIRVRERELENRIELLKAEQVALLRSKDDYILDLKRKVDHLDSEIENYRSKVLDTNRLLDAQQEQFKKALRALRLAFTSLEGHIESSQKDGNIVPIKKAE